jgi:hypothetical protein
MKRKNYLYTTQVSSLVIHSEDGHTYITSKGSIYKPKYVQCGKGKKALAKQRPRDNKTVNLRNRKTKNKYLAA